jgi:rSAM/selenodomain-associated transferase 1
MALFVRQPVPGRVKTRLACTLGDEAACDLYQAMVADSIAQSTACGLPLFLFHDGQEADGLPTTWLSAADEVFRQEGDSLGERMAAAFERSFNTGAGKVVLTGSDIPGIDTELLRSAVASLENHDVVFSPALDGGYCLVASQAASFDRRIFEGIPWSTSSVLESTLAACMAAGISCGLLEARQDIDTISDLASYCRAPSGSAAATNAWLISQGFLMPS